MDKLEQAFANAFTDRHQGLIGHTLLNGAHTSQECVLCTGVRIALAALLNDIFAEYRNTPTAKIDPRVADRYDTYLDRITALRV